MIVAQESASSEGRPAAVPLCGVLLLRMDSQEAFAFLFEVVHV